MAALALSDADAATGIRGRLELYRSRKAIRRKQVALSTVETIAARHVTGVDVLEDRSE